MKNFLLGMAFMHFLNKTLTTVVPIVLNRLEELGKEEDAEGK